MDVVEFIMSSVWCESVNCSPSNKVYHSITVAALLERVTILRQPCPLHQQTLNPCSTDHLYLYTISGDYCPTATLYTTMYINSAGQPLPVIVEWHHY